MILTLKVHLYLLPIAAVLGSYRYYGTYISYGSGDTFIDTYRCENGPNSPKRKWIVECLDGEAMVGIRDAIDDFQRIAGVWCKFMFPLKPSSNGRYPYYSSCHIRNFTDQFHCYNPLEPEKTVNTFVTGIWNQIFWFWNYLVPASNIMPYKCCKTPLGYYIDYMSCYYVPTHDPYFEFYDSVVHFLVYCTQGYVMTGMAKKFDIYANKTEYHMEWIQCCRIGYGPAISLRPPVTYARSGVPVYHSPVGHTVLPAHVPAAYAYQYRTRENDLSNCGVSAEAYENRSLCVRQIDETPTALDWKFDGVLDYQR